MVVYPVKSAKGVPVPTSALTARGLRFDRQWMVVDAEGDFVTQRTHPKLALLEPALPTCDDEALVLRAPSMGYIEVPVVRGKDAEANTKRVTIWGEKCDGVDQGDGVAKWICSLLGEEGLRLVRFPDGFVRPADARFAPSGKQAGAWSDGFPILVGSS